MYQSLSSALKNANADMMTAHIEIIIVGVLIIGFLIVEPRGLARLWRIAKEKLRLWPFPY